MGTAERLRAIFGETIARMRVVKRHHVFRYLSPEAFLEYWRRYYGPTMKAFEAVGEAGSGALEADPLDLIAHFNRAVDGTMVVPIEYLEVVITRR